MIHSVSGAAGGGQSVTSGAGGSMRLEQPAGTEGLSRQADKDSPSSAAPADLELPALQGQLSAAAGKVMI